MCSLIYSPDDQSHTIGWRQGWVAWGHGNPWELPSHTGTQLWLPNWQFSSQGGMHSHTGQLWPLHVVDGVISHREFFSSRNSSCILGIPPESPSSSIPQLDRKQNNHGQVQVHTSRKLSQKHAIFSQDWKCPCLWLPGFQDFADSPTRLLSVYQYMGFLHSCQEKHGNFYNPLGLAVKCMFMGENLPLLFTGTEARFPALIKHHCSLQQVEFHYRCPLGLRIGCACSEEYRFTKKEN